MAGTIDGAPIISLDLHLPVNGAWSAHVQAASETPLPAGEVLELALPGVTLNGTVVRSGVHAGRVHVRVNGGSTDWQGQRAVKHYRETTVGQVAADVGVDLDFPNSTRLEYWTRSPGTTGSTIEALARHLGVSWRVNPDETVRMRAEDPQIIDPGALIELSRDPARGIVTVAPEGTAILPGFQIGSDLIGDVIYSQPEGQPLRVRYFTEARARVRGALERIIRWVMRDTLYLGQYSASVVSQASNGDLDLLPDDDRLRSQGLQAVPIRHGLPGVEVEVPAGSRVLLGFDAGDPTKPYAALWHEGSVSAVRIGGSEAVAKADLVEARLQQIADAISAAVPAPTDGGAALKSQIVAALTGFPQTVAAEKLFTS